MAEAPESAAAFAELLDDLAEIGEHYIRGDETFADIDVVEGYRSVLHLLSGAIEHRFEGDGERPLFTPIVSPVRKFLGDNADARYYWTRVRGDRDYRVTGRIIEETYLSFTVHGRDPAGGAMQEVLADVNHHDLDVDDDGRYEILLSPERPAGHDGNWIELAPSAESVITRHYYSRPVSANADADLRIELSIAPVRPPEPPRPWDDARLAARLRETARYVRAETVDRKSPDELGPIAFVSREPNVMPEPARFRASGLDTVGAVDIYYAMGPFVLGPGEALVMEGTLPEGRFANVILWNRHLQTLEYRHRTTSLNDAQMVLGPDRAYRVVVAAEDPGVDNWLDTEGRPVGTVFWRFLLPESAPGRSECSVVPITGLR